MRITNNLNSTTVSATEVIEEENDNDTKMIVGSTKRVSPRGYILRGEIEGLAVRKYKECGRGIQYSDIMIEFNCSKAKAQRVLKYSCSKTGIIIKDGHTVRQDPVFFRLHKRTNPQSYFPSCLKADIIESLKKRNKSTMAWDHVDEVTGRNPFFAQISEDYSLDKNNENPLELAKAESFQDILKSLQFVCRGMHKIQLMTSITKEYYNDLDRVQARVVNRAKVYQENIGNRGVTYTFSPNGTVEIAVACSNNPFRIEYEEDINVLFSFLGQVRDRLLYIVSDPHERVVPQVNDWILKSCDLNKDVDITHKCQMVLPDLQLKYAGRVFRIYVKSLGDRAVARVEESLKLDLPFSDALESTSQPLVLDR